MEIFSYVEAGSGLHVTLTVKNDVFDLKFFSA